MLEQRDIMFRAISKSVRWVVPAGMPWRLVVLGSAASGETTTTDGRWKSDIETYLESPDPALQDILKACRKMFSVFHNPSVEISGGNPNTVRGFAARQWLVDAGNVGRRIDGWADDWEEPFATFAKVVPPRTDAVVLLSNRLAEWMASNGEERDYALAKCFLDTGTAAMILSGVYESTVRSRMLHLERNARTGSLLETGFDPALVPAVLAAGRWKLDGTEESRRAFLGAVSGIDPLRGSVGRMLARAAGGDDADPVGAMRRWLGSRSLRDSLKDWGRAFRRSFRGGDRSLVSVPVVPVWNMRFAILQAFLAGADRMSGERMRNGWALQMKGV